MIRSLIKRIVSDKRLYQINSLAYRISLHGLGILNYENAIVSGEEWFLKSYLSKNKNAIVLDVGGNIGLYAQRVKELDHNAVVYSFEPHPKNFLKLKEVSKMHGFRAFNLACGNDNLKIKLYDYSNDDASSHASLYKEVINEIHGKAAVSHLVEVTKLDDFVLQNGIDKVDLLKIDVEGNELDVLKGFEKYIRNGKVKTIHFEFNEMNLASRVFFKDFYNFLTNYDFYRMLRNGLVPIKEYQPIYCEIFAYQNIVAILRNQKIL